MHDEVIMYQSSHQQGYCSSAISDTSPIITHYHLQLTTLVGVPHSQPLLPSSSLLYPFPPHLPTPSPLTCLWWRSSCLLPPSPPHCQQCSLPLHCGLSQGTAQNGAHVHLSDKRADTTRNAVNTNQQHTTQTILYLSTAKNA